MPDNAADVAASFLPELAGWYETQRKPSGGVNTNVMCVALVIVDHMADTYPLGPDDYKTSAQVKGISGGKIRSILQRHGEERPFTSEGGRTSRGTMALADSLVSTLNSHTAGLAYQKLNQEDRAVVVAALQAWLVDRVREDFFDRQRIAAEMDPALTVRLTVETLLSRARERGGNAAGAVAQHLVGAKLALRFPHLDITNESYTTADVQTDRPGDFLVGDTAIHVTLSPSESLMARRCRFNLTNNYRPLVIVPENRVAAALQMADDAGIGARVRVTSVEEFIGGNVEEMAGFTNDGIRTGLRDLLLTYNARVMAAEPDPSLQIEIPGNL